jgi:ketosteroid isomerase-like protein
MTTSDETLAVARSYSQAFNDRAFDRLPTILDPDIVDESKSGQIVRTGADAVSESLQEAARARPDARIEVANAFASPEQALLELRMIATDPETGQERMLPTCHVYRVRNGRIVHLTTYSDRTWR